MILNDGSHSHLHTIDVRAADLEIEKFWSKTLFSFGIAVTLDYYPPWLLQAHFDAGSFIIRY